MRCCGVIALAFGVILVLFVVAIVGVAAYTGFIPGLSSLIGTDKPRDLGVHWSPADYDSAYRKAPIERSSPELYCLICPTNYSGTRPVDNTFSDRELSAWLSMQNAKYGPIRDVQVKLNADGTAEMSGMYVEGANTPFYVKGRIDRESSRSVSLDVTSLEVGRVPVPVDRVGEVNQAVNEAVNGLLSTVSGLDIQQLEVQGGALHFKGTLPQTARGSPPTSLDGSSILPPIPTGLPVPAR